MRAKDFDRDEFLSKTWPEALESEEFKQGRQRLKREDEYCCLGVACELLSRLLLLRRKDWVDRFILPAKAVQLLGITENGSYRKKSRNKAPFVEMLADLGKENDNGKSFSQIAETIRRAHKSGLFVSPPKSAS